MFLSVALFKHRLFRKDDLYVKVDKYIADKACTDSDAVKGSLAAQGLLDMVSCHHDLFTETLRVVFVLVLFLCLVCVFFLFLFLQHCIS